MDFDLYKKIIKEIKTKKSYVKNIALFMDGDPTMHKGLVNIYNMRQRKKLKIFTCHQIWNILLQN